MGIWVRHGLPLSAKPSTRAERPGIAAPVTATAVALALGISAAVGCTNAKPHKDGRIAQHTACCAPAAVRIAVGSENQPFFDDKQVKVFFHRHHLNVIVTPAGGRQMGYLKVSQYDAFLPSSLLAAAQLNNQLGGHTDIPLFESPLAIAANQSVADCLGQLGIASQANGIWTFNVRTYLDAVAVGKRWGACRNSGLPPRQDKITLYTTDPECSNSGELFVAIASHVKNGYNTVSDKKTAQQVGREIAPIISNQGYMPPTTADLWKEIVQLDKPMGVVYESVFLGAEITSPTGMMSNIVLMYPSPTIESVRTIIWRGQQGSPGWSLATLLAGKDAQPLLVRVAQDTYGYRVGTPEQFAQAMDRNPILERRRLIVQQQPPEIQPPEARFLQDIIGVADPKPYC